MFFEIIQQIKNILENKIKIKTVDVIFLLDLICIYKIKEIKTFHKYSNFIEQQYSNGDITGYDSQVASDRLVLFLYHLYRDVWIYFLLFLIATKNNNDISIEKYSHSTFFCILLSINIVIFIIDVLDRIFKYRFKTSLYRKRINDLNDGYRYLIMNKCAYKNGAWYLVKDLRLDGPVFLLVKEEKRLKNDNRSCGEIHVIVNYSKNFEEVKYEFEFESKAMDSEKMKMNL